MTVDCAPDGVLFNVPVVVLDLDGWPMARLLPTSVTDNASLRSFLASCSKPLSPALLPPRPPLAPLAAPVGIVSKRINGIVAKLTLAGPSHMISHAQRNLMRKLGLVLQEGPVLVGGHSLQRLLHPAPLTGPRHHALVALLQLPALGTSCGGVVYARLIDLTSLLHFAWFPLY